MSEPKDLPAVTVAVFPQTGLNCVIKFVSQNIIISLDLSFTTMCVCSSSPKTSVNVEIDDSDTKQLKQLTDIYSQDSRHNESYQYI